MPIEPMTVNGVLLVDKPQGWTSHDVCAFIRKQFGIKKVGHAGTLDPLATGLLLILIGKATKFSNYLANSDKEYCGSMKFGVMTDSHDITGSVVKEMPCDFVTVEKVREQVLKFTGELVQVPPMVSALKYKGTRLYKLARKGKTVPREGRNVTVYRWDIEKKEEDTVYFSTMVSRGTYVRTLVNDLGESLGTCAALASLRRTQSGDYFVRDALTIETLRALPQSEIKNHLIPLYSISAHAYSQRS